MLKERVITALFLVAAFLSALFLLPFIVSATLFIAIATLAAWEWGGLMRVDRNLCGVLGVQATLFCAVLLWCDLLTLVFSTLFVLSALFWLAVAPFWLYHRWSLGSGMRGLVTGVVVILPTWAAMVFLLQRSPWLLLAAMALVWIADIAAYFFGRTFGRHKLAPSISPGKTREGALGAVFAVLLYGSALMYYRVPGVPELAWGPLLLVLFLLTLLSIAGDLFESLLKRQAFLKDSSQLLPGHGGVLDRIDSQTSTLPLLALLIQMTSA